MKSKIKNLFDLENKVIVITGGSGFLGSEFSFAFSDVGAIPVILDKNEKSLKILEKKFFTKRRKGSFFLVDINNERKVNEIVSLIIKKYKKIDCLINAAALTMNDMIKSKNKVFAKFEKYDFELWKKIS